MVGDRTELGMAYPHPRNLKSNRNTGIKELRLKRKIDTTKQKSVIYDSKKQPATI